MSALLATTNGDFQPFPGVSTQVYSARDFEAVRQLVYAESGNVLPPGKSTLVYSRLAPLVRNSNLATFSAYIDHIRSMPDERRKAIAALTTNHTFFFREDHHFDHFRDHVRPGMIDDLLAGRPARIWSAGCSSGEEVYSLMMTLLGEDKGLARRIIDRDLAVLASDLADHVLVKAKAATYDEAALDPVPSRLRANWVEGTRISNTVRDLVRFRRLNLLGDWPLNRPFDVIFCRNVMIYFDQPTKERLVERFARQLKPGGFLYIGHSERVTGPATALLHCHGNTIYERISA